MELVVVDNVITSITVKGTDVRDQVAVHKIDRISGNGILGSWSFKDSTHTFKPLLPLKAGVDYVLTINSWTIEFFSIEKETADPPEITAFYPTADTIPENLLKCYIAFSKPMREKEWHKYISVTDSEGKVVSDVILPLEPGLWNEDRTMLTCWIDPGRVKRGLKRNRQLGAPIEAGERYTITISADWQSINGTPMDSSWKRSFFVKERAETLTGPESWKISKPGAGTKDPLTIDFPEPMDFHTTISAFQIKNGMGAILGESKMGKSEKSWYFTPDNAWKADTYIIEITPSLEDLAGNSLLRPFDRDLSKNEKERQKHSTQLTLIIPES